MRRLRPGQPDIVVGVSQNAARSHYYFYYILIYSNIFQWFWPHNLLKLHLPEFYSGPIRSRSTLCLLATALFSAFCKLFALLVHFLRVQSFIFNILQTLCRRTRGVGYPPSPVGPSCPLRFPWQRRALRKRAAASMYRLFKVFVVAPPMC